MHLRMIFRDFECGGGKPGCMASRCAMSFAGFSAKDSTDQPPPYNWVIAASEPQSPHLFVIIKL